MPLIVIVIPCLIIGGFAAAVYCAIVGVWTMRQFCALAAAIGTALLLAFVALVQIGAMRIPV